MRLESHTRSRALMGKIDLIARFANLGRRRSPRVVRGARFLRQSSNALCYWGVIKLKPLYMQQSIPYDLLRQVLVDQVVTLGLNGCLRAQQGVIGKITELIMLVAYRH